MRRYVSLGGLGVVLGLLLALLVCMSGCNRSGSHHPDPGNLYLTNCQVIELEDGSFEVTSDIVLPAGYYGLLYVDGEQTTDTIILDSGTLVLGEFPADTQLEITYCLELLYVDAEEFDQFGNLAGQLHGVVECCTVTINGGGLTPPPDLTEPTLSCNLNVEGGVATILVSMGDALELTLTGGGLELVLVEDYSADLDDLEPGDHVFTLSGTLGEEEFTASCEVTILDDDDENDDEHDHKCRHHWMTHKGHCIMVPCKWVKYFKRKGAKRYVCPRL